jgi:hypothetical protein
VVLQGMAGDIDKLHVAVFLQQVAMNYKCVACTGPGRLCSFAFIQEALARGCAIDITTGSARQ